MNKREIFEKYDNLSKNKLNIKNNKEVYVKNDVMTSVIIRSKGKKEKRTKKKKKKIQFRRKLRFAKFDIMVCK